MSDSRLETEVAVDPDEAIREEIRARLRVQSDEKAEVRQGFLLTTNVQNTAPLRLISGCG